MENEPLVSILMTVFNREKFINEAIDSVIASSYTNWELIIVDDGSKDNSVELARTYANKEPRIKLYINETNLGDYPNRNKAATYAKGEYIKYLDADDTIYKYSLNYMVEAMERYPKAALGLSVNISNPPSPFPILTDSKTTYKAEFLGKSYLGCGPSASIIKKEYFTKIGGFSGKQYIGDHELWLKLSANYPLVLLQPGLIWWRQHSDQQIKKEQKNYNIIDLRYQTIKTHLLNNSQLFNVSEFKLANKRLKQNHARGLLRLLLKEGKLFVFIKLLKASSLSTLDLLNGLKGYIQ